VNRTLGGVGHRSDKKNGSANTEIGVPRDDKT
jgi:hypothetical protein